MLLTLVGISSLAPERRSAIVATIGSCACCAYGHSGSRLNVSRRVARLVGAKPQTLWRGRLSVSGLIFGSTRHTPRAASPGLATRSMSGHQRPVLHPAPAPAARHLCPECELFPDAVPRVGAPCGQTPRSVAQQPIGRRQSEPTAQQLPCDADSGCWLTLDTTSPTQSPLQTAK